MAGYISFSLFFYNWLSILSSLNQPTSAIQFFSIFFNSIIALSKKDTEASVLKSLAFTYRFLWHKELTTSKFCFPRNMFVNTWLLSDTRKLKC